MGLKLSFEKIMQKDDSKRVTRAESSISQLASEIAMRVTQQTFNALQGRVEDAESSLVLQANQIASKVSQTDFNGNTVASLINQTATTIKLKASKIELEGLITANQNFKVLPDGSIEAKNAKLSGSIIATRMSASSNADLYGEIGVADNYPGLALYDLRYNSGPYFKIMEASGGNAVLMRDKNNITRILLTTGSSNGITFNNSDGTMRADFSNDITRIYSPGNKTRFDMTDTYVRIVRNGNIVAQW